MAQSTNSGGIGFVGLLTILFIGLKLTGHIAWSWWWVLAPIWISTLLLFGFLGIFFIAVSKVISLKEIWSEFKTAFTIWQRKKK